MDDADAYAAKCNAAWGGRIHAHRKAQRRSLRDLARRARIDFSYLSDIEHGRADPSLPVKFRIAAALGVPPHTLYSLEGIEQPGDMREAAAV